MIAKNDNVLRAWRDGLKATKRQVYTANRWQAPMELQIAHWYSQGWCLLPQGCNCTLLASSTPSRPRVT